MFSLSYTERCVPCEILRDTRYVSKQRGTLRQNMFSIEYTERCVLYEILRDTRYVSNVSKHRGTLLVQTSKPVAVIQEWSRSLSLFSRDQIKTTRDLLRSKRDPLRSKRDLLRGRVLSRSSGHTKKKPTKERKRPFEGSRSESLERSYAGCRCHVASASSRL